MQIIDLTHEIKEGMPCFGAHWHCSPKLEQMGTVESVGRNTSQIIMGSHCGTHIDSPRHFFDDARTIDMIELTELIGEVSIYDFSSLKENECVTVEMLKKLKLTEKVIFNFNWADKYVDKGFYSGYPYFSDLACDYLIDNGVKLIGMDTPSPDDSRIKLGSKEDSKAHKKFLSNGVILIEYLNNLNKIKDYEGWKIVALPLKLSNCDGSSARVCIIKE